MKHWRQGKLIAIGLGLCLLAGCGEGDDGGATPAATPTRTAIQTASNPATATPTQISTASKTATITATEPLPTSTPTPVASPMRTATPPASPTQTEMPTALPTHTDVPTASPTQTGTPTASPTHKLGGSLYITKVGAEPASSAAGQPLADPIIVQVADGGGGALAGISVTFAVEAGGGVVDSAVAVTGTDGRAAAHWTLGIVPVDNRLRASIDIDSESVSFVVRATLAAPLAPAQFGDVNGFIESNLGAQCTQAVGTTECSTDDLAFDGAGRLVLGIPGGLLELDAQGNVAAVPLSGDAIIDPQGIAFDQRGNLWVADLGGPIRFPLDASRALRVVSPAGVVSTALVEPLLSPSNVAVDAAGRVYVSDQCLGQILRYNPDTAAVDAVLSFDLRTQGGPSGFAFEPGTGRIVVLTVPTGIACGGIDPVGLGSIYVASVGETGFGPIEPLIDGFPGPSYPFRFGRAAAFDREGNLYATFGQFTGALLYSTVWVLPRGDSRPVPFLTAPEPGGRIFAGLAFGRGEFGESTLYTALELRGQAPSDARGVNRLDVGIHGPRPRARIEPDAGNWRTWVISSGADYRVPAPPGAAETAAELAALAELISHNDPQTQEQIEFWDAGAPAYRWIDMISARLLAGTPTTAYPHRVYTYVAQAMYDATIATWESKYFYNRPRPSEQDHDLPTALPVPDSPSYPSEHAAAAQAAATVLAYFLPAEAASFQTLAEQAGWSRVLAGLQYPSDYQAGLDLGRRVAEQVIAKAQADGAAAVWMGSVPAGPCNWVGTNPGNVTAANWTPLLLTSPSEFRPAPPPACDSPEVLAEAAAVRTFPRTFMTNYKAFYWQSPEGLQTWPYRYADKWIFEDGLDQNPPRVARAYALIASVLFDSFIASQDGKFTYWYLRPHQLDPAIVPLFPVPNFPSYPSNHSTFSAARSEVLAYLFPAHADFIRAVGKEAGDSRIWAGIHYQMDNVAGVALGKSVAQVFIARAENDGAR